MPEDRVFQIDIAAERDRYFDDSSKATDEPPRFTVLMGGVAAGKTTIRKQVYSAGFVLVDAAEIFLSLSRGEEFPFPEYFEEPMQIIGSLVALRAVTERRHIVTELIGADFEPTKGLLEAMRAIGYRIDIQAITCDIKVAEQRNASRRPDDISCFYAERFQRSWLYQAALAKS